MSDLKHTIESELKFDVTGLDLPATHPNKIVGEVIDEAEGRGIDVFYYKDESKRSEFVRYRRNPDGQELTRKVKLNGSNVNRIEETIKLSAEETPENVDLFLQSGGYSKGAQVAKEYDVWWGKHGILSYYKIFVGSVFKGAYVEVEAYSDVSEFERARDLKIMRDNLANHTKVSDKQLETKSIFELYGV